MARSSTKTVQTPGAPESAEGTLPDDDEGGEGAEASGLADQRAAGIHGDESDEMVQMRALLASLQAENAALKAGAAAASALPSFVFEPETPHGIEAKANSKHLHLTTAEFAAMIDRGEAKEPMSHVLCKDGYYVRRS